MNGLSVRSRSGSVTEQQWQGGADREGAWHLNYYPFHIGDYSKDTAHLSIMEDGAYRRLIDLYYTSERQLPKNRDAIYRLVRARSREEKLVVDTLLGEFFTETETGWRHERCEQEIARSKEKSEKAAMSASMRWHKKKEANALRTHCDGNAPNNQEPIKEAAPVGALDPVWGPGLDVLLTAGVPEKHARPFIGALLGSWSTEDVLDALQAASGKADPRAYVRGILRSKPKKSEGAVLKVAL